MKFIKLGLVVILTLLFVSGCFMKSADYDKETIEKAEATVESYVRNNYKDIKTVEIEEVYKSPMGGLTVDGTVNNKAGLI